MSADVLVPSRSLWTSLDIDYIFLCSLRRHLLSHFFRSVKASSPTMSFMDEIRKIPPVTRFLCASSLAVSVPVMLHLVHPHRVIFITEYVTQRFEVRRHAIPCAFLRLTACQDLETVHELLPRRYAARTSNATLTNPSLRLWPGLSVRLPYALVRDLGPRCRLLYTNSVQPELQRIRVLNNLPSSFSGLRLATTRCLSSYSGESGSSCDRDAS